MTRMIIVAALACSLLTATAGSAGSASAHHTRKPSQERFPLAFVVIRNRTGHVINVKVSADGDEVLAAEVPAPMPVKGVSAGAPQEMGYREEKAPLNPLAKELTISETSFLHTTQTFQLAVAGRIHGKKLYITVSSSGITIAAY